MYWTSRHTVRGECNGRSLDDENSARGQHHCLNSLFHVCGQRMCKWTCKAAESAHIYQRLRDAQGSTRLSVYKSNATSYTDGQRLQKQEAQLLQRYCASAVITAFKVIQGHWCWYQSKTHMRLSISEQNQLLSYVAAFFSYRVVLVKLSPMTRGCLYFKAFVLNTLCEYRHISYVAKKQILSATFLLQTVKA